MVISLTNPHIPSVIQFAGGFFSAHIQLCIQMKNHLPSITLLALLAFPASLFAFIPGHMAWVEEATTEQCKTNDWPADKHDIHIAWCTHNGYPVK